MAEKQEYVVGGFSFFTEKDAQTARDEEKKVYYIKSKLNYNDPESVLAVYNKMIKGRFFSTPIGMNFLRELHNELTQSGVIEIDRISSIPLYQSFTDEPSEKEPETEVPKRRVSVKKKPVKTYKTEYNICRIIIAGLIVCVIAMFVITMKSENPNILNYETAIQNKYSAWEQELTQREQVVRQKERELGIE